MPAAAASSVTRNLAGERGVPAVIDKDLASGLLASRLGADLLLISTSVEHVSSTSARRNNKTSNA